MNIRNLLVPAVIAALSSSAFAAWTPIYTDNFTGAAVRTSGDSATAQGLYDSNGQWYTNLGTNQSVGTLDGAAMRFKGNTTIAKQFSTTSVAIDGSQNGVKGIKISFDFKYSNTGTSQFALGLFDSKTDTRYGFPELMSSGAISNGGSSVYAPNSSQPYMAWGGYYFRMAATNTTSSTVQFRQHRAYTTGIMTDSANSATGLSAGTWLGSGTGGALSTAVNENQPILHVDYGIAYKSATELTFTAVITNRATSALVNSFSYTTTSIETGLWDDGIVNGVHTDGSDSKLLGALAFDTILLNAGSSPIITMDNFVVAIPEPATYAACLGALSLVVVGYRRFRR